MSLKMKMIPINCCDSRRSLYQNIYSLFYFRLSSILCHPCEWVCFSSLATSHICIILKNKINEALFSPSLSYILNYSQYYSTWFMDSIYSHFPLNLPFRFYHNSCSSIFISCYHNRRCVLRPTWVVQFYGNDISFKA